MHGWMDGRMDGVMDRQMGEFCLDGEKSQDMSEVSEVNSEPSPGGWPVEVLR